MKSLSLVFLFLVIFHSFNSYALKKQGTSCAFNIQDTIKNNIPLYLRKGIFTVTDIHPSFPGGTLALKKYIESNLGISQKLVYTDKSNRIFLKFVVEIDGSISNISCLNCPDKFIEDKAKQVVSSMPKWIPAKQTYRNVPCFYHLPIDF